MVDLVTIQKLELEMMKYVDSICRGNNIVYFLGYGTLIGAIRHNGFIPWDDDIDILMPRNDYEKFARICKSNKNCRYQFCDINTEERWTAPLAKVIDTRTKLNQTGHREQMDLGVYIDIFVMDGIPNNVLKRSLFFKKLDFLQKLWGGCEYKERPNNTLVNIIKNKISNVLNYFISARKISIIIDKIVKKCDYEKSELVGPNAYKGYDRKKTCMSKDVFGDGVDVEFEGSIFRAPEKYHEYLSMIYGDYMTPPPKENQISLHRYSLEVLP